MKRVEEKLHARPGGIADLIGQTAVVVTENLAKIRLREDGRCPAAEAADRTVCTKTTGGYQIFLAMRAGEGTWRQIADRMMGEPVADSEELEEAVEEFFNILCGHIVGAIAREYKAKAIFCPPALLRAGLSLPLQPGAQTIGFQGDDDVKLCILCAPDTAEAEGADRGAMATRMGKEGLRE